MEIFWNTIASYNAATWPVQILLTLVAATLTLLLYLRPTPGVRIAMKTLEETLAARAARRAELEAAAVGKQEGGTA